jgi:hypothetical protein
MAATPLDPSCKIKTNVFPPQQLTFSVYIHESWTLGKPYGIKLRCYWECLREQLGNLGNTMRTCWEHIGTRKQKQKITPRTWPHPQKEKQGPSWVHAQPSHWLQEISISKTVCHHFWPGLMAGAEIWGQWGPMHAR